MYFGLNFDIIMPPWALGIVYTRQLPPPNCTVFKYASNKPHGIRLLKFDPVWLTKLDWTEFPFLHLCGSFPCLPWCLQGSLYTILTSIHGACRDPHTPYSLVFLVLGGTLHTIGAEKQSSISISYKPYDFHNDLLAWYWCNRDPNVLSVTNHCFHLI